jgi:glucose/arabinose dehydrogenase
MRRKLLAAGALVAVTAAGVGTAAAQDDDGPPVADQVQFDFNAGEVVTDGLTIPWGLAFLPDGTALVAERDSGAVLKIGPDTEPETVTTISVPPPGGQFDERGLLGLAVAPDYAETGFVYAYHSTTSDNRVVRFTLDDPAPEPVLTGIPAATIHNGGRIAFGPDGKLYITTGDANVPANSQDQNSLAGKILRAEPDGSVPDDNPFPGSYVYTWGNRNVQGIAWDCDGELYFSELGWNTWDEVNHAVPGGNYGWPTVEGPGGEPEFIDPIVAWTPAEASPSGAAIVDGTLYVAALRGQRLWTVPVSGGEAGEPVAQLVGQIGRIRTVEHGPDGYLWVATSNGGGNDVVMRFPPATQTEV